MSNYNVELSLEECDYIALALDSLMNNTEPGVSDHYNPQIVDSLYRLFDEIAEDGYTEEANEESQNPNPRLIYKDENILHVNFKANAG